MLDHVIAHHTSYMHVARALTKVFTSPDIHVGIVLPNLDEPCSVDGEQPPSYHGGPREHTQYTLTDVHTICSGGMYNNVVKAPPPPSPILQV